MSRWSYLLLGFFLAVTLAGAALWVRMLAQRATVCKVSMDNVLSLPELKALHAELNGCVVRVRGFLSRRCAFEDCSLSSKRETPSVGWGGVLMAIGEDEDFDRQAQAFLDREVVLQARFSDECMKPGFFCTDRAPDLRPIAGTPITLLESM